MATSSSDESSTAPKEFHISSSMDSGSRLGLTKTKCMTCGCVRKVFYCKECVYNEAIYHSRHAAIESYAEKRRRLLELEEKRKIMEKKCMIQFETRQKADVLCSKIRQCRDRNRIMKLAVEDKKLKKTRNLHELARLKDEIKKIGDKLIKYDQKVAQVDMHAADKRDKVERQLELLENRRKEIMRLIQLRIEQLKHVFPITKVEPKPECESPESEMVSALAEASRTIDVRDRWEYGDFLSDPHEVQYSIVEPTLPASGNYSLYNLWVSQNKDAPPVTTATDLVEHNPAFNISAALTYTAQLIHVLAFYFNVRLPYRLVYSDFCAGGYMSEPQFTRRVARLNANVLHLCATQNVHLARLNAHETMRNLLRLLDTANAQMGRQGAFDVDAKAAEGLERPLALDFSGENTDSDEGDCFHREWETVPHVPDSAPVIQGSQQAMIATQQATSMAGGLVNSAAASIVSFWKGVTGR